MRSFLQHISEVLTLRYHGHLNKKLFDGENLKPEVRQALLNIAGAWQSFSKLPDNCIKDIIMTGGNCAYNYTKYSDIDLHIVIDKSILTKGTDNDLIDDYLADKKALWASKRNIKVRGYTVELYAQDINDHLVAAGVYSLKDNKWLSKPVHGKYDFKHDGALEKKVEDLKNTIESMINMNASESEFKIMKDKLSNMRKAALASGNEFSIENLVFKELRNQGVLDRMSKHLQTLKDKELTLK